MAVLGRRTGWVLGVALLAACGSRTSLDLGEYDRGSVCRNCAASAGVGGNPPGGFAGNAGGVSGTFAAGGVNGGGFAGGGFAGTLVGTAGACPRLSATGANPTIDDIADGDSWIAFNEGRQGSWFAYNDGTGVQSPPAGTLPMTYFSKWSAYTSGAGFYGWGAGIGLVLYGGCPYDASVYQGISFTIVNDEAEILPLSLQFGTAATTPTSANGTCDAARETCYDAFQIPLSIPNGRSGLLVGFSSLAQQGWGKKVPFDASQLISISFQTPASIRFAFYVETIAFVQFGGVPPPHL